MSLKKRKVDYESFLILLIVIITLILGVRYLKKFVYSNNFIISNVQIKGDVFLTKECIENKIKDLKGKNYWFIDTKLIEDKLEDDIRIKDISIDKIIPDTVEIIIEERKPYVFIQTDEKLYVCDEFGKIYAYRQEYEKIDLPILQLSSLDNKKDLLSILDKVEKDMFNEISELYEANKIFYIILNDGVEIKTNKEVIKEKYSIGFKLYKKFKEKNEIIEYIDLRFEDYIVK